MVDDFLKVNIKGTDFTLANIMTPNSAKTVIFT